VVAHRGSDPRRVPPGTIAELGRTAGVHASVGTPLVVDGRLWGVAVATRRGEQSPRADTEERMAQFTLVTEPTRPRAVWCAICTTAHSSGWCTPS
jgi:hypothetical protein